MLGLGAPLYTTSMKVGNMDEEDTTPEVEPEEESAAPEVDHSACEAKISTLNDALAAKDEAIAAVGAELTATKAANYDLLIAVGSEDPEPEIVDDAPDGDIDSFFV